MEQSLENTFNDIAGRAMVAVETAISEHGQDAVDLAMTIYRLEAIRGLAVGAIFLSVTVWFSIWFYGFCKNTWFPWLAGGNLGEPREMTVIALLPIVFGFWFTIVNSFNLLNPYMWAAAFGYEEIYIAARALSVAGLL